MKLSKKIKYSLGIVGLGTLTAVSTSLILGSCSDKSNTNSFLNIGQISNEFSQNMKDLSLSINVEKSIYDKAKISANQLNKKIENYHGENVIEKSENWLNSATKDDIKNMLFINFNKASKFYYEPNAHTTYKEIGKKLFFDVNVLQYDNHEKIVNFTITYYFNEMNINDDFGWSNKDINYYEYNQAKITYEFNNIKLIVNSDVNLPSLSIDKNNKNMTIRCVDVSYSTNNNQQDAYLKHLLDIKDDMSIEEYDNAFKIYSNFNDILLKSISNFINIKGLDWSTIEFSSSGSLTQIPFLYGEYDFENPIYESNFIGYKNNQDSFVSSYIRNSYSLPIFVIASFDNNESSINIIN